MFVFALISNVKAVEHIEFSFMDYKRVAATIYNTAVVLRLLSMDPRQKMFSINV